MFFGQSGEFAAELAERGAGEEQLVYGEYGRSLYPSLDYTDYYPFDDGNAATGELYRGLLDTINAALAADPDLYLAGIYWLQGEQDATSQTYGPDYDVNLEQLYQGLAGEFGDGFSFVISALSTHIGAAGYQPAWDDVRAAQVAVASSHDQVLLVDPDDMIDVDGYTATEVFKDDHHYTDTGFAWLADQYFEALDAADNNAPLAMDDAFTTAEDSPLTGNLLADNGNGADSDPDGDTLTVAPVPVTDAAHGVVELQADGSFSYTPDADFHGTDSFTYTLKDGHGGTDTAIVNLTVTPVNDPPLAMDDSATVEAGGSVSIDVLANDSDAEAGPLTVTLVSGPEAGLLSHDGAGGFSYTAEGALFEAAAPGAVIGQSFTYELSDGQGGTDRADVTLTVTIPDHTEAFAETGTLALTHQATTLTLQRSYDNPVVIAYVATENGAQPVAVRVSHAEGNALTLRLQEPDYLDGRHNAETVNYLVVEAGVWELPDGTLLEAGRLESARLSSAGFETVGFAAGFETAPVVLSQVQSFHGGDFVTTRQTGTTEDGFRVTMQEEEALNGGSHARETIGWVAIEAGSGSAGGVDWIAGQLGAVTHTGVTVAPVPDGAQTIATLSSFHGADSAWVRGGTGGASVSVEEERSLNPETGHIAETVDYFAFTGSDLLSATRIPPTTRPVLETGTVTLTHETTELTLDHAFDNPVVIAWVATENGMQPVNVRVSAAEGNHVTLQLQEPNNLDGAHMAETVNYVVVEAGAWVLPDGTILEAGELESGKLSSAGFETVAFTAGFETAPVVLSQVQSFNGPDFVTTRQDGTTEDGFRVTMQEEEALNGGSHARETIGWLAIEAGSGSVDSFQWIAGLVGGVTDAGALVNPGAGFQNGAMVAGLASFAGADPAWVRGNGHGPAGFGVSLEEDQSHDAETSHTAESVGYLAFNEAGVVMGQEYGLFV